MSANTAVVATFTQTAINNYSLTVSKVGSGTVTSDTGAINCGATCSASLASGSTIILTAAPAANYTFNGWSGGVCSGTGTCSVTMSAARTVVATFTSSGGGGTSALSFHTYASNPSGNGTSPMTTSAVDTTSATPVTILVQMLTQTTGAFAGLSDNKGNTYVRIGSAQNYAGTAETLLYKCENATVGTGHTFSLTKPSGWEKDEATIFVVGVNGGIGSVGVWSFLNTSTFSGTAITTTAANSVVVSFWGPADWSGGTVNYTPPSGWTKLDQVPDASNSNSGADAYKVVAASGTSVNTTWTSTQSVQSGSSMWLIEVKP
jgi:hypothetical protein